MTYRKSMQNVDETIYHYLMQSDTNRPIWRDKTGDRVLSIVTVIQRFQDMLTLDKNVIDMTLLGYEDEVALHKSQALGSLIKLLMHARKNMGERWWTMNRTEFLHSLDAFFERHGIEDGLIVIYTLDL